MHEARLPKTNVHRMPRTLTPTFTLKLATTGKNAFHRFRSLRVQMRVEDGTENVFQCDGICRLKCYSFTESETNADVSSDFFCKRSPFPLQIIKRKSRRVLL